MENRVNDEQPPSIGRLSGVEPVDVT